jgi:hypothetical protein
VGQLLTLSFLRLSACAHQYQQPEKSRFRQVHEVAENPVFKEVRRQSLRKREHGRPRKKSDHNQHPSKYNLPKE